MAYSANENSWSYGTVADFLTVTTKVGEFSDFSHNPATERHEHYSKAEALALLETLADWAETYEGEGTVHAMLIALKHRREKS